MKVQPRPKNEKGRFIPLHCPNPECDGDLQYEGDGLWRCDGLLDPGHDDKELAACEFTHYRGDPWP